MPNAVNRVIKFLIYSDLTINSAWGFLAPVFAIFIVQRITADNVANAAVIAGFADLVYWLVKSVLQIPIGNYLDKNHGEKDDLWAMVAGLLITASVPVIYAFSTQAVHVYFAQAVYAVGMALVVPSWSAIFTRHIDKGEEAFEWSVRSTALGIGTGITGALGGILVAKFGFNVVLSIVSAFTVLSALLLTFINRDVEPKNKVLPKIPRVHLPI